MPHYGNFILLALHFYYIYVGCENIIKIHFLLLKVLFQNFNINFLIIQKTKYLF